MIKIPKNTILLLLSVINLFTLGHLILGVLALIVFIIYFAFSRFKQTVIESPEEEWFRRTYDIMKEEGYTNEEITEYVTKVKAKTNFEKGHVPWWLNGIVDKSYLISMLLLVIGVILRVLSGV